MWPESGTLLDSTIKQRSYILNKNMAEGVGFEPTHEYYPPGGFQDHSLEPLGYPSKAQILV